MRPIRGQWVVLICMCCVGLGWLELSAAEAKVPEPAFRSGVGVNLGVWADYNTDLPTIDQFRRANAWFTRCLPWAHSSCKDFANGATGFDTREQARLDLDEHGWVRSLPRPQDDTVKFRHVSALLFQGDGGARPSGQYVVLYDGKGTIEYGMSGRRVAAKSRAGRDIVEISADKNVGVLISITATDPRDYIRNIRVIPPGGVCEAARAVYVDGPAECRDRAQGAYLSFEGLLANQRWNPGFLGDLFGFRALRYVNWTRTNDSELAEWKDRPRLDDAVWSGPHGVPIEAIIDLSNVTRTDPWINLPTRATDDYARQFARMAKERLDADRTLYLEYGNEPWNFAFGQSQWIKDQGVAHWSTAKAKGIDDATLATNWYALRASQLCSIVKGELGQRATRVKCVANGQAANAQVSEQTLACPLAAPALGRPCAKYFDALAVAPYFGFYVTEPKAREMLTAWLREPDGGLNSLFDELLAARDGKPHPAPMRGLFSHAEMHGALAGAADWMKKSKLAADRHGLPMLAYEGGQHLVAAPGDNNEKLMQLLIAANRDPRMGQAYSRMLVDWRASGGQLFMYFDHIGMPNKFGAWGLKESQSSNADPKWLSALTYRDRIACWWPLCAP